MQLERARTKNFRSLRDVEVSVGAHTALIGGNGAGKSSILKAIEKSYNEEISEPPQAQVSILVAGCVPERRSRGPKYLN